MKKLYPQLLCKFPVEFDEIREDNLSVIHTLKNKKNLIPHVSPQSHRKSLWNLCVKKSPLHSMWKTQKLFQIITQASSTGKFL